MDYSTNYMRPTVNSKKGLIDLINFTKISNIKMIEIGSFSGESTSIFLNTNKIDKIFCIDPWMDNWSPVAIKYKYNMKDIENIFDNRFKDDNRVIKHKGTIDTFIEKYKDLSDIDLVYIDGNHSRNFVEHDIQTTLDKIHPKFISGHDYNLKSKYLKGVVEAVNKIFDKKKIKTFCDTSWIFKL